MVKKVNEKFFDEWNEESAYALGFIFADGSIVSMKEKYYSLVVTSTDKEVVEQMKTILGSEHKIGERANVSGSTQYVLSISNSYLCKSLMEKGVVERKTRIKEFPFVPVEFLHHFIRGYFDGNGHFTFEKYNKEIKRLVSGFTTGSKSFADTLSLSLKLYGINANVHYREKSKTSYSDSYFLRMYVRDTRKLYDLMYKDATVFLQRKKDYYDQHSDK